MNERAQSGLALIHILAALGYDWGLQVLLPLGAKLNLQVRPSPVEHLLTLLACTVVRCSAKAPLKSQAVMTWATKHKRLPVVFCL